MLASLIGKLGYPDFVSFWWKLCFQGGAGMAGTPPIRRPCPPMSWEFIQWPTGKGPNLHPQKFSLPPHFPKSSYAYCRWIELLHIRSMRNNSCLFDWTTKNNDAVCLAQPKSHEQPKVLTDDLQITTICLHDNHLSFIFLNLPSDSLKVYFFCCCYFIFFVDINL